MSSYRTFYPDFWKDTKVVDTFTPEDKYFMLWAVTNSYVNIIGCYEVSIKQISNDLGYTTESVENLIKRFNKVHKNVQYDFDTKEILVVNFNKYNWTKSPKLDGILKSNIEKVKSQTFKKYLVELYNSRETIKDTLSIPYTYPIDTSVTDTVTEIVLNKKDKKIKKEDFKSIINEFTSNEELEKSLLDFVDMRKHNKSDNFTIQGLKRNLTTLNKLSSNEDTQIEIVNQTIEHGWKSFYQLKEDNFVKQETANYQVFKEFKFDENDNLIDD